MCLHVEEWNFVRQRKMDLCVRQRKWNCLQDGERMDLCVSRREDLCVLGGGCGNRWSFEGDLPNVVERMGTLAG